MGTCIENVGRERLRKKGLTSERKDAGLERSAHGLC